jgi:hypothetical protein
MTLIAYRKHRFQGSAASVVDQANTIIKDAKTDGWYSMTLRQLYYQFVSRGFIPNTVKDYKRLGRIITDARYCGLVSWTAIEDAGRNSYHFPENPTPEAVLRGIEFQLTIDPWADQDSYVEVWVEKQALEATVARPCSLLNAPYMACKGYLSASEAWRASLRFQKAIRQGKHPVLLHLGDHDPSGIDMTRDNGDRLQEFLNMGVEVRRIALNMDQVQQYNPPPNPAKEDDSRFASYREQFGDESWELDALRQNTIGEIITENLNGFIDQTKWDAAMVEQDRLRKPLAELARQWTDVEDLVTRTDQPLKRLGQYDDAVDAATSPDLKQSGALMRYVRDGLTTLGLKGLRNAKLSETTPDYLDQHADAVDRLYEALDIARNNQGQM